MKNSQTQNYNYDGIAWGALFVWWGITEMVHFLPDGSGAIGIGLILLGVNIARSLNGVPTSGFSTLVGILALAWGGLELAGAVLAVPFELPVFAILLIVLGIAVFALSLAENKNRRSEA